MACDAMTSHALISLDIVSPVQRAARRRSPGPVSGAMNRNKLCEKPAKRRVRRRATVHGGGLPLRLNRGRGLLDTRDAALCPGTFEQYRVAFDVLEIDVVSWIVDRERQRRFRYIKWHRQRSGKSQNERAVAYLALGIKGLPNSRLPTTAAKLQKIVVGSEMPHRRLSKLIQWFRLSTGICEHRVCIKLVKCPFLPYRTYGGGSRQNHRRSYVDPCMWMRACG